ncbi:MAG: preprotein translocase subunit SecA [Bacteroidales bacterium]|jgi:preprotein translocase subunit SecA|nr:preprotein translocase subunit SecA [Bacteroidales bacterium]
MSLFDTISNLFGGTKSQRDIKDIEPILHKILECEEKTKSLSNDDLRNKTLELRVGIQKFIKPYQDEIDELKAEAEKVEIIETDGNVEIKTLDIWEIEKKFDKIDEIEKKIDEEVEVYLKKILPEAFAIMKETAKRFNENENIEVTATEYDIDLSLKNDFVDIENGKAIWHNSWVAGGNKIVWDMVHYNVQLIGGIVLNQGKIAEMATGEGKTLVATLPVFLNALTGRGVHIVTVNDYLAKRDSEWMGPLYMFHGLTVDCIDKHEPNSDERKKAYNCDITFGTNNEFGFDYLRDNMALSSSDLVQRKHNYAIVDEVDSVLIDDARTPLIISGPTPKGEDQLFDTMKPAVQHIFNAQKALFTDIFNDAKKLLQSNDKNDVKLGGRRLLQSFKALPKNKPLIKFLSEAGNKVILQSTEEFFMQNNSKDMPKAINDLFDDSEKINKVAQKNAEKLLTDIAEKYEIKELSSFLRKPENEKIALIFQKNQEIENSDTQDFSDVFDYIKLEIANYQKKLNNKINSENPIDLLFAETNNNIKEISNNIAETKLIFDENIQENSNELINIDTLKNQLATFIIAKYDQFYEEKKYGEKGLYFVIDEKQNSVEITDRGFDLLANETSDPFFFVMPNIVEALSELEKTHPEESREKAQIKDEIIRDYSVKSERIHTVNQLLKAYTLFDRDIEYVVIDNKVKIVDEQTGRIMEGRRYSDGLHQAIEAKENVKIEAATQTYATITLQNYFRMYHKLSGMTGTAETEAGELWDIYKLDVVVIPTNKPIDRNDDNDLIYKTQREKYKAVIDKIEELIAEGRPVLVGTTSVEVSELLSNILKRKGIRHNVLNAKLHKKEADIVADAGQTSSITIATNMAGRGTDIKLSQDVKTAGGLAIIGTERHESRRVDRQLRGRAGRQGDPGSSLFYVSLEDNLMRVFGSERIAKLMDRMGLKEGEVIQHKLISNSIERAQKKVEENNFGIRKRLLEYDDVMNAQRIVVYKKRRNALDGERLGADIANMIEDVCISIADEYLSNGDFYGFEEAVFKLLSIDNVIKEQDFRNISKKNLINLLKEACKENHKNKTEIIANAAYPYIKNIKLNYGERYKNVVLPVSDGIHQYNVVVNIDKAIENKAFEVINVFNKTVVLKNIDDFWKEHLREMDELRQSVQSASYEQKDPLLIYKLESFDVFKTMVDNMNKSVVSSLMKAYIPVQQNQQVQEAQARAKTDMSKLKISKDEPDYNDPSKGKQKSEPIKVEKKIGRNDLCPCGSGKKFKNCHGINSNN